jgi:hypothetical protein
MKTTPLLLLSLLCITILCGCFTPDRSMKRMLGKRRVDVIAEWGLPQRRMPDGDGGEIWVYFIQREWTTPGEANTTVTGTGNTVGQINTYAGTYQNNSSVYGNATTTYTPPQVHRSTSSRTFFLNGDGIVYRYAWQGL